jgi:hypothetical protein
MKSGPLQQAQQPPGPEPNDIFQRLEWSVLDPPSEAQIFGLDDQGVLQWRPLFDKSNKPLFDGAAIDPPQFRLEVSIEPLHSWWHWHDAGIKHVRPPQAIIDNPNGRHISVKQVIQAVHDYTVPLLDIGNPSNWDRARFYHDMITGGTEGEILGQPKLAINVVEDPTGNGENCAWIWEDIEIQFKKQAAL